MTARLARRLMFSLRRLLLVNLLLFALLPAALVTWLLAQSSAESVGMLANQLVGGVAVRVQAETESQLQQAHVIMNGLFPVTLNASQIQQARRWLDQPTLFEPMAFALTRQSPSVPSLYLGTAKGQYFGVKQTAAGVEVSTREVRRDQVSSPRRYFLARQPGDRSQSLPGDGASFEPRTRNWYEAALRAGQRVFSPVYVSPAKKQLVITLSQPVYDDFNGAAGVFAADLGLQSPADFLRTQTISSHGAAYVVDESGLLVASSAGDALYRSTPTGFERVKPAESRNPVVRASYEALQAYLRQKSSATVLSDGFVDRSVSLQRLDMANGDPLITVRRPLADELGLRWTLVVAAPESDFTAATHRALMTSLLIIACVLLMGSAIAFYVARAMAQRLVMLGEAAQRLGVGEVPQVDQTTHISEVRQLSQVLHDSAELLDKYRSEVRANIRTIEAANQQLGASHVCLPPSRFASTSPRAHLFGQVLTLKDEIHPQDRRT